MTAFEKIAELEREVIGLKAANRTLASVLWPTLDALTIANRELRTERQKQRAGASPDAGPTTYAHHCSNSLYLIEN